MKSFRLLALICFLPLLAAGQQIIVNSNGDKIVMYPDGSWRPMDAQDSILLRNVQKSEPILSPDEGGLEISGNLAEEQNFLIRQARELNNIILEEDKKVQQEFRNATNAQFKAAEMLHNAEANKELIAPDRIESLKAEYEHAVKELKDAKQKQKSIRKLSAESIALTSAPEKIKKGNLNQLKSKYNLFLTNYEHESVPFAVHNNSYHTTKSNKSHEANVKSASGTKQAATGLTVTKGSKQETSSLPPASRPRPYASAPFDCRISIDTIDKESHRRQIQVAPSMIFTHTDPDLRPYFKNKELITCRGSVVKIGTYHYLAIEFQIGSSHSLNNFGALQKGSLLRFKMLNGEYISLYNLKPDRGHIDAYSGNTVFSGQYALGKDEIRKLLDRELDKIRVLWATGYEDYDVYYIDFFKNQMNCLEEVE